MRANPAVVNGAPRSEVNTKGDLGSCWRCSRRSAPQFIPADRLRAWGALLDPADRELLDFGFA